MQDILSKLLELNFPKDKLLQEANKKLGGTYMLVNGKLHRITVIDYDYIETNYDCIRWEDLESFEMYMPQTGVYLEEDTGTYFYLGKYTDKQWRRSLNADLFYLKDFDGDLYDLIKLAQLTKVLDLFTKNGKIFYNLKQVPENLFNEDMREINEKTIRPIKLQPTENVCGPTRTYPNF